MPDLPPMRGRGSATNPRNRFERIERVPEPVDADEVSTPATQFLPDSSRTVIASNESPDVGFDASINPYRGCEHGCVYCLAGETPILMADGTTKLLEAVRLGDEIIGTVRQGWYRSYMRTRVLAHWEVDKPAYRITLQDGTQLITSGDHRFLTERGWKFVTGTEQGSWQRPHLTTNNKLMGTGAFVALPPENADYRRGYLSGVIRGDGHLAFYEYQRKGRKHGNQYQFRLAMADQEALDRAQSYLSSFGVETLPFLFQQTVNGRKPLNAIRTHAKSSVERIEKLTSWAHESSADWRKGFLAGIFDAEGSYSGGILRISNTDGTIIEQIKRSLRHFGFNAASERRSGSRQPVHVIRLCGGLRESLRFLHTAAPAIARKRNIQGQALKHSASLGVVSVEPLSGRRTLFDITTGTGDFIANGVVSHNCYARPTHEYLGFSAGLDFETKIMVKYKAPELLRRELSDPKWEPKVLAMSGVTDCYQPVEKKLELTRRCLEVLRDFLNPVVIVTKNFLVTRDIDLLSETARYRCAAVLISLTTLDAELSASMEPRASRPARRLAAIEALAKADVPVGFLLAPMIPALTDSEAPAIVAAAVRAGARFGGYTPLRLPFAVKELFENWLHRYYPEKKDKILNRIRAIRGGRLNDPNFHTRMTGEGIFAEQMAELFRLACKKAGITERRPHLSTEHFRRPSNQLGLF